MLKLISLKAEDFKNLDIKVPLSFPPEGNILVIGLNESGKSTLFEAVFFAITGKLLVTHTKKSLVDAIKFFRNKATVELKFLKKGIPCLIHREIFRSGSGASDNVYFIINCESEEKIEYSQPEFNKNEIQEKIEEFLNFDGDILLNSCFVQQKDLDGFINTQKKKKDEIIHKLLGMKNLSELRDKYDTDIKKYQVLKNFFEYQYKIKHAEKQIEKIEAKSILLKKINIEYQKIKDISEYIENLDLNYFLSYFNEKNKLIKTIQDQIEKNQNQKNRFQKILELFISKEKCIQEIELNTEIKGKKIQEIETLKKDLIKINGDIQKFEDLTDKLEELKSDFQRIKNVYEKFKVQKKTIDFIDLIE
ncbi:MAG: AAA family ATPase, partial [Candidatus Helarchaeota archaeon]